MPLPWSIMSRANDDSRRNERLDIFVPVRVRFSGRDGFAFLLDLSSTGAKVGAIVAPKMGEVVVVEWEGAPITGRCAWSTPCRFGVAFDRALHKHSLAAMLAR